MAIVAGSGGSFTATSDTIGTVTIDDAVGNDRMLIVVGGQSRSPPNMATPSLASAQAVADQLQRQENVDIDTLRMGVWVWDDAALPTTANDFTLTRNGSNQWLAWQYFTGVDQTSIGSPEEIVADEGVSASSYTTVMSSVAGSELIVSGGAPNTSGNLWLAGAGGEEFGGARWTTNFCVAGYEIGGNFSLSWYSSSDYTLATYRFTEAGGGVTNTTISVPTGPWR